MLTWEDAAESARGGTVTANAVVEFINDADRVVTGVDPSVARELAVVQAGRDLEKTMMGMRTQQISTADLTQALQRTQVLLTQQGRAEAAQDLADATKAMRSGDSDSLNKTLIGAIWDIERGKRQQ